MHYKFRTLENIMNHCPHPSLDELLAYELWELHEAAFILSSWPQYIIKNNCSKLAKNRNVSRDFFYEAAPPPKHTNPFDWSFDPTQMNTIFLNVFTALREALASGQLVPDRVEYLGVNDVYGAWQKKNSQWRFEGECLSFLFSPDKIILWALEKGVVIPHELQDKLGIYVKNETFDKATVRKVKIKITGQLLLHEFPGERCLLYQS